MCQDNQLVEKLGYPASAMGPALRVYVERQLVGDVQHYGLAADCLTFDWSNPCQEGHVTEYLDGRLEEMSNVSVQSGDGSVVANGWVDFIHCGADAPLFVFWLFLSIREGDVWRDAKKRPTIPAHVWEQLPDRSKELCAVEGKYDSRWNKDPLVRAWRHRQNNDAASDAATPT